MKPEIAKTKWCPFSSSRAVLYVNLGCKEMAKFCEDSGDISTYCIADECMCWSWSGSASEMGLKKDWEGYCGLKR